jgi:hypothetical protein
VALTLVTRAPAAAAPSCPGEGFDAVDCDVALVTAATGCAPRAVRTVVKRMLRRVQRRVANARTAAERGLPRLSAVQLGRAASKTAALGTRLQALRDRGRLADDCAAPMARHLDDLGADLESLRAGPSSTTIVSRPTTSSTVTTSTVVQATITTTSTATTTTEPTCGNGRLDRGEQCDGTNLFGRDCLTLGYHGGGQLMCRSDCLFETRDCRR